MYIKKVALVFGIFLCLFNSVSAKASPQEVLDFAKAIIQTRIEFKNEMARYFLDPAASPQEEKEKVATFAELLNHPIVTTVSSQGIADGLIRYVDRYTSLLKGVFENPQASAYFTKLDQILKQAPELYPTSEEDLARHQVERMYLEVWTIHQEELAMRRDLKHVSFTAFEENGYSELPTLKHLLKTLSPETHPGWVQVHRDFSYDRVRGSAPVAYSLSNPGFMSRALAIEEKRQKVLGFDETRFRKDKPQPIEATLESHLANLNLPIHKIYAETILYQRELSEKCHKITQNKLAAKNSEIRRLFDESEYFLQKFLVRDFTIRVYPLMTAYYKLLTQMETERVALDAWARKRNKKARPGVKKSVAQVKVKSTNRGELSLTSGKSSDSIEKDGKFTSVETSSESDEIREREGSLPSSESGEFSLESSASPEPSALVEDQDLSLKRPSSEEEVPGQSTEPREVAIFSKNPFGVPKAKSKKEKLQRSKSFRGNILRSGGASQDSPSDKDAELLQDRKIEREKSSEDVQALRDLFSHGDYRRNFELLFDDTRNHLEFTFEEIQALVTRVGGKIIQNGTSHCLVVVPGGVSHSWRPHRKGHSPKLSKTCVKLFRHAFEMAGITPEVVFGLSDLK
jgi:hypothetical protein